MILAQLGNLMRFNKFTPKTGFRCTLGRGLVLAQYFVRSPVLRQRNRRLCRFADAASAQTVLSRSLSLSLILSFSLGKGNSGLGQRPQ